MEIKNRRALLLIAVLSLSILLNTFFAVKYPVYQDTKREIAEMYLNPEKILIALGLKENPAYQNTPIVYHAYMADIHDAKTLTTTVKAEKLPDMLVIPPGIYEFAGNAYNLSEEGLYRFLYPGIRNEQRIVYENDLNALLSGVAHITSHGNYDNFQFFDEKVNTALHRKLVLTCGHVSSFAHQILKERGIKSRLVCGTTLEERNTYNNGHSLIEVYKEDEHKWVLYDLDNNVMFTNGKENLSLFEFVQAVKTDNYEMLYLANDVKGSVLGFVGGGYDYSLFMEKIYCSEEKLREWYRRVMMVPAIEDQGNYYFTCDEIMKKEVEARCSSWKYLDRNDFLKRFYSYNNTKKRIP